MEKNGWIKGYEWIKEIYGDKYFDYDIGEKSIFFKIAKIKDTAKHNLSYENFEYIRYDNGNFNPTGTSVRDKFNRKDNLQSQLSMGKLIPVRLRIVFC